MPGAARPQSPLSGDYRTRSLFPQGPSFTLETFSSRDFIVKDFIESLSESAAPVNRRSGPGKEQQAFDPRPLIRSFEAALNRLSDLSGDLEERETELSAAVRRAEAQHNSNIQSLSRRLDRSLDSFRNLDSSLNGRGTTNGDAVGGNEAVKIGERLEELDRQRARANDAQFLIRCWFEVSERGDIFLLEDRRQRARGEEMIQVARISRQLLRLSQRLDPVAWAEMNGNGEASAPKLRHNTREIVEKFVETLEKDLLTQFDDFYKRDKYDGMRECAEVLQDFGGGASVIGTFVNQHPFFLERSQQINDDLAADSATWESLADPDAEAPGVEPSLKDLVDEVKLVVQDESRVIRKAFSYYELVMAKFLQRIFQQSIQQRLELVLEKANTVSALAFLRSLQAARGYINTMVDDLKAHGLTENPEPLSSSTALILDQQFDDLFVPYFAGSSYIEREKRNLEELYSSLLFKFTIYHSRKKGPTTILASLAKSGSNLLNSARDAALDRLDSSDLAPQQKKMLLRVAGLKETVSARKQAESELSESDGRVSTDNSRRMLRWLAEAVGRGLELSPGNETPKHVLALLELLLQNMGQQYIEVSLDAAIDGATVQESTKNEPDLSYLDNLSSSVTCMHLMLACINTVLIPLAASNTFIRRDMEKKTNGAMGQMEDKVNTLMQKTIDVTITWVGRLLANQKKTDFRPKEDAITGAGSWLELLQTPTCDSIFKFLSRVHTLANNALAPSPNLTSFLTEVAVNARSQLLEHFKKFQVSATGGIMLTKDISKYNELLRSWHLDSSFEPSMEVLTEIGNIFVINPEALRERLRARQGTVGAAWDVADLRPYILRREDASSVGVQSALSAL